MKSLLSSKYLYLLLPGFIFLYLFSGCRKFLEVASPVTSINSGNVYKNDNTAIAVLTGMYQTLGNRLDDGMISLSAIPELSADNLSLYDFTKLGVLVYYQNNLSGILSTNSSYVTGLYWSNCYKAIYVANAAIEGLTTSTTLTPVIKQQLMGEAKFFRAFYYWYLINLYGDAPLVLSTNYKINAQMGRTPIAMVYEQIVSDLKDAQGLLNDNYLNNDMVSNSSERIRINKAAATAMLARVYLCLNKWPEAENAASQVIGNNAYQLVGLNAVFLKNSKETIWCLQPTARNINTWEAYKLLLPASGPGSDFPYYLSGRFIQSFEPGDMRLSNWVNSVTVNGTTWYYPYKYKVPGGVTTVTEYEMVLRLSEQYLIRAEARAQQGRITGDNSAESDLNQIRGRAGLAPSTATTKEDMLNALLHERRVELFTEWGHRWFDLKRTGEINDVMYVECPLKGGTWAPYKALYPIAQSEIDNAPGMKGQQNPGYIN